MTVKPKPTEEINISTSEPEVDLFPICPEHVESFESGMSYGHFVRDNQAGDEGVELYHATDVNADGYVDATEFRGTFSVAITETPNGESLSDAESYQVANEEGLIPIGMDITSWQSTGRILQNYFAADIFYRDELIRFTNPYEEVLNRAQLNEGRDTSAVESLEESSNTEVKVEFPLRGNFLNLTLKVIDSLWSSDDVKEQNLAEDLMWESFGVDLLEYLDEEGYLDVEVAIDELGPEEGSGFIPVNNWNYDDTYDEDTYDSESIVADKMNNNEFCDGNNDTSDENLNKD